MSALIRNLSVAGFMVITGCLPSLHPLYTDDDLTFDQQLVGEWVSKENAHWTFSRSGEKEYMLFFETGGDVGVFTAHLLTVQTNLFLDLSPYQGQEDTPYDDLFGEVKIAEFFQIHFCPVHTFYRVLETGPVWKLAYLKPEWLGKLLEENPDAIPHEKLKNGGMLLTAHPKELQAFVAKHANTPEAWEEWPTLTRKSGQEADAEGAKEKPTSPTQD